MGVAGEVLQDLFATDPGGWHRGGTPQIDRTPARHDWHSCCAPVRDPATRRLCRDQNAPEPSKHVLSTARLTAESHNLTFMATEDLRSARMIVFSAAKLTSFARWLTIFRWKIVVNWN